MAHIQAPEDGQSSASDEDHDAVEVFIDPSNPYRRKSSLVRDDVPPHLRRAGPKTECLVHQFLESERNRARDDEPLPAPRKSAPVVSFEAQDISHEEGLHRPQDPKGIGADGSLHVPEHGDGDRKSPRCALLECEGSESSDVGQQDEKEWRSCMTSGGDMPTPSPSSLSRTTSSEVDQKDGSLSRSSSAADLRSRLLTKKQLSEMAWGVRELSRRLGSIRLKFRVRTVFLLVKVHDREIISKARELTEWLLDERARGTAYTVYVEEGLKGNKEFAAEGMVEKAGRRLRVWDERMCRVRPHTFDFVITLGGDGTVLYASWLFQRIVPPVLSFALGSLGFLTKFDFADYQRTLTGALNEGVSVSLRLRFEGTVMRSQRKRVKTEGVTGEEAKEREEEVQRRRDLVDELIGEEKDDERTHRPDGTFEVLNEIVVDRGPNPTMSEIEIFGDDEHFTTVMADGVCVSTPTGSTAYNLAAGGSLCHPENPVMLLTAISPHTLSFRPVVLPDTIVLRLGVPYNARTDSWASFDGRERIELRPGDYVTISASRYPFASVQMHGRRSEDWINSISAKLSWNSRSRPKAFKEWEG
ncbi:ATP-NAD kinase-like domain-containing protein [Cercophora newfieldiana]|uniref:ATP-NAD kinase-like domain-containing protein n=1 Tax=Cercophora newfieldiana TaxID=92897 RepID=A0AA39XR47_9PEZI|nr:ATP-NAD kinase-like domain-containing protein [Cercophora newfieldiana]